MSNSNAKTMLAALEAAGGMSAVARYLRISRQAVYQWKEVPAKYVLAMEAKTGISRHKLRPDIFGKAP